MVAEDRYCTEILDQVSSATRALNEVALGLVHGHLVHCVGDAVTAGGDEYTDKIDEATAAIARLVRS